MITAELLYYIQDCKKHGFRFFAIKDALISYGWDETDIANAYLQVSDLIPIEKRSPTIKFSVNFVKPISKYVVTVVLSVSLSMLGAGTYLSLHAQTTDVVINPLSTPGGISRDVTSPIAESSPVQRAVAGIAIAPSPTVVPTTTPTPSIINTAPIPKKSLYTIAVLGDSMVDTMGEKMDFLQSSLHSIYPNTNFTLYNYGIGAQNIEQGLARFSTELNYKTRHYPSLSSLHPDIIIIASFSYNPFSPPDKDRHKTLLTQLVEQAKSTGSKVYMLAEIAPLQYDFAKGPHGVADWTDSYRAEHAQEIVDQLQNVLSVSKQEGVGLIDAFDKTEINGEFGSTLYTNNDDGIHPSTYGHTFTADLIAKTLALD